jgi:hypothetical protein
MSNEQMDGEKRFGFFAEFKRNHPTIVEFIIFFLISNGVTVLQMILMPLLKYLFGFTPLVDTSFQVLQVGRNLDGSSYFVFDYAAGAIPAGGGGGLAYFLAVEITLLIAQVINFFLQRNVTFKSNSSIGNAAVWYFIAWVIISVGASALQGLYKVPVYDFCMNHLGKGAGITVADIITMIINCAISFWVFFPIMKLIFKQKPDKKDVK